MTGPPGTDSHENRLVYIHLKKTDERINELQVMEQQALQKSRTVKSNAESEYYLMRAAKIRKMIVNLENKKEVLGNLLLE